MRSSRRATVHSLAIYRSSVRQMIASDHGEIGSRVLACLAGEPFIDRGVSLMPGSAYRSGATVTRTVPARAPPFIKVRSG
jgi:hypothetical protein